MKQVLFFLLLASTTFLVACNDDDMTGGDGNNSFEAQVDGNAYSANGLNAYATVFSADNSIAIYGTGTPGTDAYDLLFIALEDNLTGDVGTYELGLDKQGHGTYTNSASDFTYSTVSSAASGTLEVTERTDTRIKGTFSLTLVNATDDTDIIEVQNGSFDVEIR